ncbi:MAG: hypothetical protein HFJ75_01325 [Eggerthellaceae bacterium]|nr:hypothetical protein [Eggerthellaceae bacterium]
MFSLLRSDVYRLVHGKALAVAMAVLIGIIVVTAVSLHAVSDPGFLILCYQEDPLTVDELRDDLQVEGGPLGSFVVTDEEGEEADDQADERFGADPSPSLMLSVEGASESLTAADFAAVSAEMRTFSSPTEMLGMGFVGGGLLTVVTSLLVAVYFASDFGSRFIRNLVMSRRGRWAYYGEKLVLAALIALLVEVVALVVIVTSFLLAGFGFRSLDAPGALAEWLLLVWLTTTAYAWLTALVVWLTRSMAAAIAEAVTVSTGMVGATLTQLAMFLGGAFPWVRAVPDWLLVRGMDVAGTGAEGLLAPSEIVPFVNAGAWAMLVALLWMALCAALALGVCRRRDV